MFRINKSLLLFILEPLSLIFGGATRDLLIVDGMRGGTVDTGG